MGTGIHDREHDTLTGAVRHLAGMTYHQDIWDEAGKTLIRYFHSDLAAFGESAGHGKVTIHHWKFSERPAGSAWSNSIDQSADTGTGSGTAPEIIRAVSETLETRSTSTLQVNGPSALSMVFIPVRSEESDVVMIAGRGAADPFSIKTIKTLQTAAELIGATVDRRASERNLVGESGSLEQIRWMLSGREDERQDYTPEYGALSRFNQNGLILSAVGRDQLREIVSEYMDLLDTSATVYELNGDYAFELFTSGWCRMMDTASRKLCNTESNMEALKSGKWLCHESCWKDASLESIKEAGPVDVPCNGGINLYAVPVRAGGRVVGSINFGYGDPPTDETTLRKLSEKYRIPVEVLRKQAESYPSRPKFIIDLAKRLIFRSSKTIGYIVERALAEQAVRESEKNLRITLNSIGDAVIVTDLEGRITRMNPVAEELTGWNFEEAGNIPLEKVMKIYNARTGERASLPLKKVLKTGQTAGLANDTKLVSRDGREYQIADSAAPILDSNGQIAGMVVVFRNVSEEYRIKQRLAGSEKRFRELFNHSRDGFVVVDEEGKFIDANEAFCEMLGYTMDELRGMEDFYEITPPEWREWEREQIWKKKLLQQGYSGIYEKEYIRKDGSTFPVELQSFTVYDDSGNISYLWGVARDITERKKAEEELQKKSEAMEASMEGIALLNSDQKYIYLNEAHAKIYGYESPDELLGENWTALYDEDELNRFTDEIMPEFAIEGSWRGEAVGKKKDGSKFPQSISLTALEEGGLICVVQDITERRKAEEEGKKLREQLVHSQKIESIGRLAGGVAHDYNNMLNVIIGNAELAMEKTRPDNPLYSEMKEILEAARRSTDITQKLLAFARKQTISPRNLNLNDTVEGMMLMMRRLIGEDIELAWKPEINLWHVKMDPVQIDQVLANLCVNARDAISGIGKIIIETGNVTFDSEYCSEHVEFVPGDFVMLAVSDNGCGMDRETIDNLFEPFFTTKGVSEGTGLGLATVYGIVKQNDGFINVYSEPGKGTTFKLYLPRHAGELSREYAGSAGEFERGGDETVLLVEDELSIMKLGKRMLEILGYEVVAANRPVEAIRLAEEHEGSIDLLFTDVVMPEMNGRDLADKLQELYPGIKTLFMSGYTANVIAHHGVLDDNVNFIQKPFSRKELAEEVRKALRSSKG